MFVVISIRVRIRGVIFCRCLFVFVELFIFIFFLGFFLLFFKGFRVVVEFSGMWFIECFVFKV